MPLTIPEVDDTALANPPLAVVICQVRFEQNLVISDGDTGLKIHEALGGRDGAYPLIEPIQTTAASIEFAASGLPSISAPGIPNRGWRFKAKDNKWTVSVLPDNASIETTSYTTWRGDFRERLNALLDAISTHVTPSVEERLGLRFVNRISVPEAVERSDWTEIISNDLLGPVGSGFWSAGVDAYQQQMDLDIGDGARCLVRSGFTPDQSGQVKGYLLDYDVFRQIPQRFQPEQVIATADRFNRTALALFHESLHPNFLAKLRSLE